jgi:hypothetical protein
METRALCVLLRWHVDPELITLEVAVVLCFLLMVGWCAFVEGNRNR